MRPFPDLFAERARAMGEAVAVSCRDARLSYRDLLDRADRVAAHLAGLGAGPGHLVGVLMDRGVDLVAALLGVLRCGAAYVPLDPSFPGARLASMVEDAGVRLILTDRVGFDLGTARPVPYAEAAAGGATTAPTIAPVSPRPDDLAYVIYTSGSTGRPKGVMISHRALSNLLLSMRRRPGMPPGATLVAVTTVCFDIAALELFLPLLEGAHVVVAHGGQTSDPVRLAALIDGTGASVMQATPATWRMLQDIGWRPPDGFTILCGGEKLPPDLAAWFAGHGGPAWDLYGPTETTIWSTTARVGRDDWAPVAATSIHILDADLRPVPGGGEGELYIGGLGLARGYLGRPALTAERFLPDPFGPPGGRLYRTGDVARRLASGGVEIVGRTDHQIKIRGFRVEAGEVEAALAAHPAVARAVVVARPGPAGEARLVAYLVPEAGAGVDRVGVDRVELRDVLRRRLPSYMIPATFVTVAALPLTLNGKVDRSRLPEPRWEEQAGPALAPRTAAEHIVARAWREVFALPEVGVDDDFFDLGGHSLIATRLASRLRAATGADVPISALLADPTPAGQARALAALAGAGGGAGGGGGGAGEIPRRGAVDEVPLSAGQRRLWFVEEESGVSGLNSTLAAYRVRGPLDDGRLRSALQAVADRHDVLRTVIRVRDGEPVQRVSAARDVALAVHDAGGSPQVAVKLLTEAAARPFDLCDGPLMRATLAVVSPVEHLVLFQWHHLIFDGWSQGVFLRDLATAYEGGARPAPPLRFADYALWERGSDREAHLAYWRGQLAGLPEQVTPLPDRPRPERPTGRGAHLTGAIPAEVMEGLRALCARRRVTFFAAVFGAFAVLLGRHAATRDVVVGVPSAGRDRRELEELIGFFVNTLVLRLDLSRAPTVGALLDQAHKVAMEAQARQEVPFDRLVEELRPPRQYGRHPLFQVMLNLEGAETGALRLGGLDTEEIAVESGLSRFDLVLTLKEHRSMAELEYSTELFDAATAERLLAQYLTLLGSLAAARPEERVSALTLRTRAEEARLARWNRTDAPYRKDACVHELVEEHARRTPERTAVSADGQVRTYREVNRAANRLAHRLRALGIGPDDLVGVLLPNGMAATTALLGVLKAGAAYVPLDPAHPVERLARIAAGVRLRAVVSDAASRPAAPAGTPVVDVDGAGPDHDPAPLAYPENLAYVLTTSGSTGTPKSVALPHDALVNLITWQARTQLHGVRTAQLASLGFDVSFQEIFITLASGGEVAIPPAGFHGDPERLAGWVEAADVQQLITTPTMLDHLARRWRQEGRVPASLAEVTVAGELFSLTPAVRWLLSAAQIALHNQYGPSETHCAMAYPCPAEPGARPPIGRPIANKRVHLLDEELDPVPTGAQGEICVGGVGLARGYLNRPAMTAERFLPDPYGEPGARLYRTGDLGRMRADGQIVYLGRADDQIKVRGVRVEPAEIEAVLMRQPGVRAAAVALRSLGDDREVRDPRLVAYIVADADADAAPDPARLSAAVRRELPAYLVPSLYLPMAALPTTTSGKLNRAALPAPEDAAGDAAGAGTRPGRPPSTHAEQVIAAIWADVLGVERVNADDDLFALGGHSLLATRIAARMRAAFGVEVTVRHVLAAPTVAGQAEAISQVHADGRSRELAATVRADPPPLSSAQARLWFLDQLQPGRLDYHLPQVVRLRGPLDVRALTAALSGVLARHETLRTRYADLRDGPVQVVDPPAPYDLPFTDLAGLPPAERERHAADLVERTCFTPFDLAKGPVFRAGLIRLAPEEHLLVTVVHHIASDGWSLRLFDRELERLYAGRGQLKDLPVQYADYATWEAGASWEPMLDSLVAALTGVRPLDLPADRPRPRVWDTSAGLVRRLLPRDLAGRVRELARRESVTPFMVLFAAYAAVLAARSGRRDIVVGTPAAGRDLPETQELIGCFVNTLALRVAVPAEVTFGELVARVGERAMAAYEHQRVPFERVVERLSPPRDLSRHPIFDTLFTMTAQSSLELPGLTVTALPVEPRGTSVDLSLEVEERLDGGYKVELEYARALFDPATAEGLAEQYEAVLRSGCARPDRPVSGPGR
ncbi:non-ribosomal peptide synthetase [Nonomuraea indica]|uniref:non-ribosomal peptide synthetase n=1 Tax=Nonomuraea indica TaxID=1581193 RepID=UPI000C7BF0BF|nr:non-ribosomal peptide synthetase [Nonomuraea indica]